MIVVIEILGGVVWLVERSADDVDIGTEGGVNGQFVVNLSTSVDHG